MRRITALAAVVVVALCAPWAQAQLMTEDFSYANGNLVGNGGWTAHSGAGAMPVQVLGGQAIVSQDNPVGTEEDVNKPIGSTLGAGGTYYAAFDMTNDGGSASVNFFHMKDAGTSFFAGRVWIRPGLSGGDYTVGVTGTSGTATNVVDWGTDLSFLTSYRVVVSYDFDSGSSSLWVNPANQGSTSVTQVGILGTALNSVAMRQAGAGNSAYVQTVDNICVGDNFDDAMFCPEPGTALLIGLGTLMIFRRRR